MMESNDTQKSNKATTIFLSIIFFVFLVVVILVYIASRNGG